MNTTKLLDQFFDDPSTASIFFNCAVSAIDQKLRPHYILLQQRVLLFGLNAQINQSQYESMIMYFSDYSNINLNDILTFQHPIKLTYNQLLLLMKGQFPHGLNNNKTKYQQESVV